MACQSAVGSGFSRCRRSVGNASLLLLCTALILGGCAAQNSSPPPLAANGLTADKSIAATAKKTSSPAASDTRLRREQPIWPRMRRGFKIDLSQVNGEVERLLRMYEKNPRYIGRMLRNAGRYMHYVVEELEKRDMPLELALLPIVESLYDPFAYSPGRASGMWQFIPGTARFYGLREDWWYDGRRDVRAATEAALRYLEDLAVHSEGDWLQALAGYNAGWGTVAKAIRRNERQGRPVDAWSLKLPKETEAYVPRFSALALIVADPEKYGLTLPQIPNRPYFVSVHIDSQIDLALAAELADVPIEEIYQLNPGFSRWATPPQGPHDLLVPVEKAAQFKMLLEELPRKERLGWTRYKVQAGDSLSSLAGRFGTAESSLRHLNGITDPNLIRVGDNLLIPSAAYPPEAYALSEEQRGRIRRERSRGGDNERRVEYTVRPGDSLWKIARSFGIRGYGKIATWNGISSLDPLQPGQVFVLWVPVSENIVRVREPIIRTVRYRVRPGDSLSKIAVRFGVESKDIARWNSLSLKGYIHPDQILVLYVDVIAGR